MKTPNERQLALPAFQAATAAAAAKFEPVYLPEYQALRAKLATIPHALDYLPVVDAALLAGTAIPAPFHDHALSGLLSDARSVIVGELEDSDVTFILIYRRQRGRVQFVWIDQHDDAYSGVGA